MAETTTLGRYLVNKALPPEYRKEDRTLSGSELEKLLTEVGRTNPEKYKDISNKLVNIGRESAYTEGVTLKLSDSRSPIDRTSAFDFVRKQEDKIRSSDMSHEEKDIALDAVYSQAQQLMTDQSFEKALASRNPFALQVESKARGSKGQLASLMSTPATFKDARGRLLPIFVGRSYAEGLKPWEYYAATFGARQGVVSTKMQTPLGGDLGKQLNVMAANLIITDDDCGTTSGVPFDVEDKDSVGSVLARDLEGFKAGSVVDAKMLNILKQKGVEKVILRSPMACGTKDGLCKMCAGHRENGKFPNFRDAVGILSTSALAERVAQGALNVRHGGAGMKAGEGVYGGFPVINQLVQVPETFKNRAGMATVDGRVESVTEAPQGGFNIVIGNQEHYVEPQQTVEVKVGDAVEAGDQLSTGILNPAEIVQYKGVGEGRRYLAERLTKAFRDSKLTINRRNAEVAARALINRVDIDDPEGVGDYLPGDSVSYNSVAYSYVPRKDSRMAKPADAVGGYLEQPALHYTIGTKLSRKMAAELDRFGESQVMVNENPPGFTPVMERLRGAPAVIGKDWMAKLQGSNLKANLMKDIQYGAESNIHGTHPIPGLAYGAEFGESKPNKVTY